MNRLLALAALVPLAACSSPAPVANDVAEPAGNEAVATAPAPATTEAAPAPSETVQSEANYLGRWTGVEGTYLNVARRDGGGVMLEMQYDLDHKGSFPGAVTGDGIKFTRDGAEEILRPTDGDATGLKWLAGKKDCLTVKAGEGYCRK